MITILHGTDTAQSRKFFLELKNKADDPTIIDGQKVTLTDLTQYFEGGNLFAESKSFFIDQLLSKRKKSKELDGILEYLNKASQNNEILLWEDKELTPAALKSIKNPVIRVFKLPQTLFQFLDNIKPGNSKILINLFHETIETADTEMVFYMLVKQFRLLLALSDPGNDDIDEVKRIAPWQKTKLQRQTQYFKNEKLIDLYNSLLEIEIGLKTGSLPANITQTIDLWLLGL
jgi:hypothetical protein